MKNTLKSALFVLLMCGVFGADEEKSMSVMEGDSVTLNPDPTQIQGFIEIEWRFKNKPIAYTDGSKSRYPNPDIFRDRLKLNQTGSLTILNMKTRHSGLYRLQIDLNSGPLTVDFAVTVYESPSVIGAVKGEMKLESVTEGDPVTLQTDVTQLHGDELIVWRFGDEGKLIAKADIESNSSTLYPDERFRDRLKLDQTGSLTITDTRTTHSGPYTVKISSSRQTSYKRFTVTVSGLSRGAVAGIVVGVLLVAAAGVVAGVMYHRRRISELQKQIMLLPVPVKVKEGEDVTLKPNHEIKKDDHVLWQFGGEELMTGIAETRGETRKPFTPGDVAGGRFTGRLELDKTTGSLTIKNTRITHSGVYTIHITPSSGKTSQQTFTVTVSARLVPMTVGGSVTLKTDLTKIQRDEEIQWRFGDEEMLVAGIKGGTREPYGGTDKRFGGRLRLNEKTGDLNILYSKDEDAGRYKLWIHNRRGKTHRTYVVVIIRTTPVMGKKVSTEWSENESDVEMQPLNK